MSIPTVKVFVHDRQGKLITEKPVKFKVEGDGHIRLAQLSKLFGEHLLYGAPDGVVLGEDSAGLSNVPFRADEEVHLYQWAPGKKAGQQAGMGWSKLAALHKEFVDFHNRAQGLLWCQQVSALVMTFFSWLWYVFNKEMLMEHCKPGCEKWTWTIAIGSGYVITMVLNVFGSLLFNVPCHQHVPFYVSAMCMPMKK